MGGCKPYLDVDRQIALLESRGISFSDKQEAARFLLKESYYSVVNGYKDAFLDKEASAAAGDDRYPPGLSFQFLELAYVFDMILRRRTMDILLKAESTMKTVVVHAFCAAHPGTEDYLDPSCFCGKQEYYMQKNYTRGLIRLLSTLQSIRDNKHHKDYIEHYKTCYGAVPLWVVAQCITFGNMSSFFDYQQRSVKTKSCINLARALGRVNVRERDMRYAFRTLPEFRNICAHDERLYCAGVGKNGDKRFPELLRALSFVVSGDDLSEYAGNVDNLLGLVGDMQPDLMQDLLGGMRITRHDLQELAAGGQG